MELVVDSNELFAGIITKSKELQSWTLDVLFSSKVKLFAPFRLLAELERNKEEIKAIIYFFINKYFSGLYPSN